MRPSRMFLLATLLLAACGPGKENKPVMEQERAAVEKAKGADSMLQQQAQQHKQEAEKQTQ